MLSTFWTTGAWRLGAFLADLLGNTERSLLKRPQKVMICDLRLVDCNPFCVFLCFKVRCFSYFARFHFLALRFSLSAYRKHGKFRFPKWNCFWELPNPEEPQIWEGENGYRLYLTSKDSLDPMVTVWLTSKKIPKSRTVFDHIGRVLSETAVKTSILERMLLGANYKWI